MLDDKHTFQIDTTNQKLSDATIGWIGEEDSRTGYDAVSRNNNRNRRQNRRTVYLQDTKLRKSMRRRAIATSQDLVQNFSTVAWAVRKHLDYVSDLEFQATTGNDEFDEQLEDWFNRWSREDRCDIRRRHCFRRYLRMAEARRCVDGDFFVAKIGGQGRNRGMLQPIEAYRIEDPIENIGAMEQRTLGLDAERWVNGVEVDNNGAARRYAIFSRTIEGNIRFDGFVRARRLIPIGYYERFDQVRGISPLMAGLTTFTDVYEGIDMHQAKMRISALFGLSIYRDAIVSEDNFGGPIPTTDADQDGIEDSGYEFDFGGGPQLMDLEPGDRAEFLESRTPPQEVVDFMGFMLNIALKTLDLPDSFLCESSTNFFGSRAALMLYLRSAKNKQQDLMEFADRILEWRIPMAIQDGDLLPPRGMDMRNIRWRWNAAGFPWAWDPLKEARAAKHAIELGADNIERIAALNGTVAKRNKEINRQYYKDWDLQLPWQTEDDPESALMQGDTDGETG